MFIAKYEQDWLVDFEGKKILGSATHTVRLLGPNVTTICFDSAKLTIKKVYVDNVPAKFTVAEYKAPLGSAIQVQLSPEQAQVTNKDMLVRFDYEVSSESSACQWLAPSATKGGKKPFLFTQCQAIHARSLLPCFDSPGVKVTYTATVKAPAWATGTTVV
jgi:leukotriene-A4 hydrolase